ncbi:putative adenine nucleotide alpha hydrolase (AANH) superfamily ATPase [Phyllobacterium trifolii]|uniref:Putative adenine nucleotide alpha hydrolase (AANH) superfamily ATPase n=1 Tax=Phyllobacterium trifolii TaxID=300193 RepID=A0A839ULA4_9HYPH|nr:hypothetical protein [Phyllobacterium trifolii]MBB3149289.1 putative adenine nucleotide alpha hydrolase (AANH) superfamily ATPase [Phyllobacterium trifolii]
MRVPLPKKSGDHSNRTHACEAALKAGFEALAEEAMEAGWDRYEVALALSKLGEQLVEATAENAGSAADIAIAKALFEIKRGF